MKNHNLLAVLAGLLAVSPAGAQMTNLGGATYTFYTPYTFVTLAGQVGVNGFANGTGTNAAFWSPAGVAVDSFGNVFVADHGNSCIRKIAPDGTVSLFAGLNGFAGSADGIGPAARFFRPNGMAIDNLNRLYVTDENDTIRMVTPDAVVTTLAGVANLNGNADGTNSDARFDIPTAVTLDSAGNLFVTEYHNNRPRKITHDGTNWVVTTIPSSNYGGIFIYPAGIAVDSHGLICQGDHDYDIKVIKPDGVQASLLGGATSFPTPDPLEGPQGLFMDAWDNLYVANSVDGTIVLIPSPLPAQGTNPFPAGLLAGLRNPGGTGRFADGTGTNALFSNPAAIAVDSAGTIYVADTGNSVIRKGYFVLPGQPNSWVAASGKWEASANWSRGFAPSVADSTDTIGNAGANTVTIDASTSNSSPASLRINNLDLTANTLSLANSSLAVAQLVRLGNGAGNSTLRVQSSGLSCDTLYIGNFAGSTGTVELTDSLLRLSGISFSGPLLVGVSGDGTLNVAGSSTLSSAGNAEVGLSSGSHGHVEHSGGVFAVGSSDHPGGASLFVGRNAGSVGAYHLSQNTGPSSLTVYGNLYAGGDNGNGSFTQDAGSVQTIGTGNGANGGYLFVGYNSGSSGSYTLNGGSVSLEGGELDVGGQGGGTGILTVNNSAIVNANGLGIRVYATGTVYVSNNAAVNTTDLSNGGHITLADNGQLDVSGNVFNDGVIEQTGGNIFIAGRTYGTGVIRLDGGTSSFADGSAIDIGDIAINGGTATAAGSLMVGKANNSMGVLNISAGSLAATNGTFGIGNTGVLTNGSGSGQVNISGGSLTAASVIMGSTAGGSGEMNIEGGGTVTVLGGFTQNDVNVKPGGELQVVYNAAQPAFEDTNLHNRIVGGYLRDGTLNVTGGTVSAPEIVLGLTNGTGILNLSAGSVTATSNLLVGMYSSATGIVMVTGGTLNITNGVFGVGNAGSSAIGSGTGRVMISNATVTAASIQLGSANGGSGEMEVQSNATVTSRGGLMANKLKVNGGTVQVTPGPQPAFEDPMLHNRIVAGYLHNGELDIFSGVVSTPEMLLGVTSGKTGTLSMSGGLLLVQSNLVVGDCANSAAGAPAMNDGALFVTNAAHNAVLDVRNGTFAMSGGRLVADTIVLTNPCGHFVSTGGTIQYGQLVLPSNTPPLQLTIAKDAGPASVILSWPSAYIGYELQQNTDLGASNWTPVNVTLNDDGVTRSVALSTAAAGQFYRLTRQ